jgi:SAM-dependent methyltransferase
MGNYADSKERLADDARTIKKKSFLKQVYIDFYKRIIPKNVLPGPIVELGSGGGFIKEINPGIITSDIIPGPGVDQVFFAEKMPFKDKSISAFLMVDVFHHIKDPEGALKEMNRCLKVNGKILMVEAYITFFGKLIYKHLHQENCDLASDWKVKGQGRISDSNIAMPWIIFVRDRKIFKDKFPNLKILRVFPHTPFSYLFSGGLTKFQFLPGFTYPFIKSIENLMSPINSYFGMFATIAIQKK